MKHIKNFNLFEEISSVGRALKVGFNFASLCNGDTVRHKKSGKTFTVKSVGADTAHIKEDGKNEVEIKSLKEYEPVKVKALSENNHKAWGTLDKAAVEDNYKVQKEEVDAPEVGDVYTNTTNDKDIKLGEWSGKSFKTVTVRGETGNSLRDVGFIGKDEVIDFVKRGIYVKVKK